MTREVPALNGAFTPLVAPFQNGAVDYDLYAKIIDWQIDQGTQGLLVNATSGEPTTLTAFEKARLIEVAVKASAGRRPVVADIPAESHVEAVTLLARAEKAGADAIVSVTPYYARPPQRGLIEFFVDLAARTELPFLIYHIPGRAAVSVAAETFEAIAERCPNFVGSKNTDDDLALVSRLISRLGPHFRIFGGLESTAFAMCALGGCGTMITTSNVAPKQIARLNDLCLAGRLLDAQRLAPASRRRSCVLGRKPPGPSAGDAVEDPLDRHRLMSSDCSRSISSSIVRCGRCGADVIIIDQGRFRTDVGRHYVDMYGILQ